MLMLAGTGLVACGGGPARTAGLAKAGEKTDDGTGQLARTSVKFRPIAEIESGGFQTVTTVSSGERYGGFVYGGTQYGGLGTSGGRQVDSTPIDRTVNYAVAPITDAGIILGRVTWPRPPTVAATLATACGDIANPTLTVGAGGAVGGAIVFLVAIEKGKPPPQMSGPTHQGGLVYRDGCALWPQAQVVAPVPARMRVSSAIATTLVVTRSYPHEGAVAEQRSELAIPEYGEALMAGEHGITRIGVADDNVLPAWLVAVTHPYIARTASDGSYRLDDVVPGTYQLTVWYPPVATGMKGTAFVLSAPTTVTRSVVVGALATARLDVALP